MTEAAKERIDSGEFVRHFRSKYQVPIWIGLLLITLVTPVIYVAKLPTAAEVKTIVKDVVNTHEARNAHHGVQARIQAYAVPLADFAHLKARVDAQKERWKTLIDRLAKIEDKIDDLILAMPRKKRQKKNE